MIKKSTQTFIKEAKRIKGYSFFDLVHGFVYMRWPYLYIAIAKGDHPLVKTLQPLLAWFTCNRSKKKVKGVSHIESNFWAEEQAPATIH